MKKAIRYIKRKYSTQRYILISDLSLEIIHFSQGIQALLLSFGFGILAFLFLLFAVASIGFLVNIPITKFHLLISILLTNISVFVFVFSFYSRRQISLILKTVLLLSAAIFLSVKISAVFLDLNYDSQWYHLEAIIALENGWNPVRKTLTSQDNPDISSQSILNSYQKAQEIGGAVIYKTTGKIETAKSINLLSIIMAFSFGLSFFLSIKKLYPLFSFIASLFLVANPITLIQYLSSYIDGTMYNFMLSLIFLLLIFYKTRKNIILIAASLCTIFLWNLKLTAIVYVTVFYLTFLVYVWYKEQVLVFSKLFKVIYLPDF